MKASGDKLTDNFNREVMNARVRIVLKAVIAICVVAIVAVLSCGCSSRVNADNKASGQPLDSHTVTEYDRPAWLPACDHAYKVTDRESGQQWWLLVMHEHTDLESYVALPIERGDE